MAKGEKKERFETQRLPPMRPAYSNLLREGIGVPFPELECESASEIAAKATGYIGELAARTKLRCSDQKLTQKEKRGDFLRLLFVACDGVNLVHELAKAFPELRKVAEVLPEFPCMFPAHPGKLKCLKDEMWNIFNLGKRHTFKLRASRGRKTFSFETEINKLLVHYICKIHSMTSWLMIEDFGRHEHRAATVDAIAKRMALIYDSVMPDPLTPKSAKEWLDIIWVLLLQDIPEPEKHPQLRKLGQHPSRTERAHFGERKTTRSIKDAVGENAKHQTAGYVRAAIKEALGKYLVRMLRKEQSDK